MMMTLWCMGSSMCAYNSPSVCGIPPPPEGPRKPEAREASHLNSIRCSPAGGLPGRPSIALSLPVSQLPPLAWGYATHRPALRQPSPESHPRVVLGLWVADLHGLHAGDPGGHEVPQLRQDAVARPGPRHAAPL